jgi:DNA packaging protein, QLRG family
MTIEQVKDYLRVDGDDDDNIIQTMMEASKEYIVSAVGEYDENDKTASLLFCAIVQNMYDNRELMQSDIQQKKGIEYTFKSIILQLQMKKAIKGGV